MGVVGYIDVDIFAEWDIRGGIGVDRIVSNTAHSGVDGLYVSKSVEKLTHRFLHKLAHY